MSANNQLLEQLSNNVRNVELEEGIPKWAGVLLASFNTLIDEIKKINHLANRIDELEAFKKISEHTTDALKKQVDELKVRLDDQEQRGRNWCLLMHGVEETEGEDTDDAVLKIIKDDLGIHDIEKTDIVRSHRIGPRKVQRNTRSNTNNSRPIIFRFKSWNKRMQVFKSKRVLKGKKISITESLTSTRVERYKLAIAKYGYGHVWTAEGRIVSKDPGGKYVDLTTGDI